MTKFQIILNLQKFYFLYYNINISKKKWFYKKNWYCQLLLQHQWLVHCLHHDLIFIRSTDNCKRQTNFCASYCKSHSLNMLGFISRNAKDYTVIASIKTHYALVRFKLEYCSVVLMPCSVSRKSATKVCKICIS